MACAARVHQTVRVRRLDDGKTTMSFESLGLHEALTKAVSQAGYDNATEVQLRAIPPGLEGKDLMVSALSLIHI